MSKPLSFEHLSWTTKKLLRSTQVLFPSFVDAKFAAHEWVHRRTGHIFKKEFEALRQFNLTGKLLLDVGANRGQSIVAFQNAVPGCRITAFEPNRCLADRLAERYADDRNVQIEACALSNGAGKLILHIPSYRGFLFDGLASVQPENARGWFTRDRFYFFDPSKVSVEVSAVFTRTLDSYDLAPALIKLTAQRAELLILQGAEKTIRLHRPLILAAWAWKEEIDVLGAYGYRPYGYRGGQFRVDVIKEFTWFLLPEHIKSLGGGGAFSSARGIP
jgi:FkbM family methyltransferase